MVNIFNLISGRFYYDERRIYLYKFIKDCFKSGKDDEELFTSQE